MHCSLGVKAPPSQWEGYEWLTTSVVKHCTFVGKTPSLLLSWREVVCNICSHALEFGWVRLPLTNGLGRSCFAASVVMHWILGGLDSPLTNVQERSDL